MSSNIDHIFYINLDYRTDRREQIETELNNFGLSYERVSAIRFNPGLVGCGLSHIKVLRLAKERGYKNILILEDDFTFLVSKETFEEQLRLFFDSKIDYDICMLSYNLYRGMNIGHPSVQKVLEAQTTSGYIVNSHYYDILIHTFETAMKQYQTTHPYHQTHSIDQFWKPLQPVGNWYYFKTRIGKQRASYSDISEVFIDVGC